MWSEQQKLGAVDLSTGARFGEAVAISGYYIAITASADYNTIGSGAG